MTKSLPKLVLSSSRDIPFSQLVLSQKNVRRVKAGLSIEDLAGDIYHRTLLQSLNVRAIVDADGNSLIDLGAGIAVVSVGNAAPAVVVAEALKASRAAAPAETAMLPDEPVRVVVTVSVAVNVTAADS